MFRLGALVLLKPWGTSIYSYVETCCGTRHMLMAVQPTMRSGGYTRLLWSWYSVGRMTLASILGLPHPPCVIVTHKSTRGKGRGRGLVRETVWNISTMCSPGYHWSIISQTLNILTFWISVWVSPCILWVITLDWRRFLISWITHLLWPIYTGGMS